MRYRRPGQLNADLAWRSILKDNDWLFKTGIGGTINALSGLLLAYTVAYSAPLLFPIPFALIAIVNGYLLSVIRYKSLSSDARLPDWENWTELLFSGLAWMAVQCSFGLGCIVFCLFLLVIAKLAGAISSLTSFVVWGTLLSLVICFVIAFTSFLLCYLMVNFALEERTSGGYAVRKVLRRAGKNLPNFVFAWLLGMGVLIAAIVVPAITLIGLFLIPSALLVGQVIAVSLATQVWGGEGLETSD